MLLCLFSCPLNLPTRQICKQGNIHLRVKIGLNIAQYLGLVSPLSEKRLLLSLCLVVAVCGEGCVALEERRGHGLCWHPHDRSQSSFPAELRAHSQGLAAHNALQHFWPLAHQPLPFADILACTYCVVPV